MKIGVRAGMIGGALLFAAGCSDKTYVIYQLFLGGPPVTTGSAGGSGGEGTTTSSSSSTTTTTTTSTSTAGAGGQGGDGGQGGSGAQGGGEKECGEGTAESPFAPLGTFCGQQTYGDCKDRDCNGLGSCVDFWNGDDINHDGDPCTLEICTAEGTAIGPCTGCVCSE
jgi:hypothetical protein